MLGGRDLSPRRRQRHPGHWLAGVVVLAVLVAGGYLGYRQLDGPTKAPTAAATRDHACVVKDDIGMALPAQIRLAIRNTTLRIGLAAQVRSALRKRGFHVASIGNATMTTNSPVLIRYSIDQARALAPVREQFAASTAVEVPGRGALTVYLGPHFPGVVSTAAAGAAQQRDTAAETARSSPSCRPSP